MEIIPIAYIRTAFPTKFGIPRQSGMTDARSRIVFESEYRIPEAFRGLEEYSHIWVLWEFSEVTKKKWSPTVRPPRLGGNERKGVFATRSPFRPNSIALSCLQLEEIVWDKKEGPVLVVTGADMMDGTPIFDIKPYLPYVDSHPEARGGFTEKTMDYQLEVVWDNSCGMFIEGEQKQILTQILSLDPRPAYQNDPDRIYGMVYDNMEIKFQVKDKKLFVVSIEKARKHLD
ncbi:MAG: tRNA (N6-threonylcarbamoyladenosine(37)-N6)-methyltransferase TrmO [Ruminococcus sp.]|nr:tRNA (N6-threonylcarbamoyladenosine(37)-N6)-methyltransferase TrmO [Ruminococcus sp.]